MSAASLRIDQWVLPSAGFCCTLRQTRACTAAVAVRGLLQPSKSVTPELARPGEVVTYTLTMLNEGTGKSANPLDSLEEFPAQWRKVSLTRGRLALEPGDCELIEELQRKVLPKLAVRITDDDLQCSPNQLTLGQPRLEVEALLEMPKPDAKKPDES